MTVCVATLFKWNYAPKDAPPQFRTVAITASDRMLTAANVQYEPQQQKIAFFGRSIVLIAGDIQLHMEAIAQTEKEIQERELHPQKIAQIYGRNMQSINRRYAENEILAPLGLTSETFAVQQKDLSENFVNSIANQLQARRPIDADALIVGSDGDNAHIYFVDSYGNDYNLDGVGFGAIGIGAWHAKSRLMQIGYTQRIMFASASASIYAAKKNAELAPGVGKNTDMFVVFGNSIEPLLPAAMAELERLYEKYRLESMKLGDQVISELQAFIDDPRNLGLLRNEQGQSGQGVEANESVIPVSSNGTKPNGGLQNESSMSEVESQA